jgi:hypothetical protein
MLIKLFMFIRFHRLYSISIVNFVLFLKIRLLDIWRNRSHSQILRLHATDAFEQVESLVSTIILEFVIALASCTF